MAVLRLWRLRAWARRGVLALIAGFVACATAMVALALAGAEIAGAGAIRGALTSASDGAAISVRTRLAADPEAQDVRLREVVTARLDPLALQIGRHLVTEPTRATANGEAVRIELAAVPADAVTVSAWPSGAEAVVPEGSVLAGADTIVIGDTQLAVVGTWEPAHPAVGGAPAASAAEGTVLVGREEDLLAIDGEPFVVWDIAPDFARVRIEDLSLLAGAGERLNQELRRNDAVAVRGLAVTDLTGEAASDLRPRVAAARAVTLVPVGILGLLALLTLVQLTGLLARSRGPESTLLAARGTARARFAVLGAGEGALVGVVGAAAGAGLAAGVLLFIPDGVAGLPVVRLVAIGAALVTIVTFAVLAAAMAGAPTSRAAQMRAGRIRRTAGIGAFFSLAVVAGLAASRFAGLHGPVTGIGTEDAAGDVVAITALPLALALVGVSSVLLLTPATALIERLAGRGKGLDGVLAARQVARRLPTYAVPALLLALGAATVTSAGMFEGTATAQRRIDATLANGADLRIVLPAQNWAPAALPSATDSGPFAALDGVTAAASARTTSIAIGKVPATYVALPAHALGTVVAEPEVALGVEQFAETLVIEPHGDALPDSADHLMIDIPITLDSVEEVDATEPLDLDIAAIVRVLDADGGLHVIPASARTVHIPAGAAGTAELAVPLPPRATSVLSVAVSLGIDVSELPGVEEPVLADDASSAEWMAAWESFDREMQRLRDDGLLDSYSSIVLTFGHPQARADGEVMDLGFGYAARVPNAIEFWEVAPSPHGAGLRFDLGELARLGSVTVTARSAETPSALPAVVTEALADEFALQPGSVLDIALDGPSLTLEVVGIVPAIPGTTDSRAVLVDQATAALVLAAARDVITGPTEIWIAGEADVGAEPALALAGPGASATAVEIPALDPTAPARLTFWLAGAAGGLCALIGVAGAAVAQGRERRREVRILAALGIPPRDSGRARALELFAVAAPALLLGSLAGWLASTWFVSALSRSANVGTALIGVRPEWGGTLLALGILALGIAVIAALTAAGVRNVARTTRPPEEGP